MPFIHSVSTALPKNFYSQDDLIEAFKEIWGDQFHNFERIEKFHKNVEVDGRYLSLPKESYIEIAKDFGKKNDAYQKISLELCEEALSDLIETSNLDLDSVGMLQSTTVTGLSVPSLDAKLMNKIPFKSTTKRVPLFGLGCLAGVSGINRASDYLKGHPKEAVIFVSVELCSLTIQADDLSVPNMVSTGLFGDGAAAVLLVGDEHPLKSSSTYEVVDGVSNFYPQTERIMGWDFISSGFKIVLSNEVPKIVKELVPENIQDFLTSNNLKRDDLDFFVSHPGGPKVMMAMEEALSLKSGELCLSWESLKKYGNMSSTSVLFILKESIKNKGKKENPGELGLMLALGPAFCSEFSLLKRQ